MDRKSITILLISILAIMGWSIMVNRIWPPVPPDKTITTPALGTQTLTNQPLSLTNPPPTSVRTNLEPIAPESILTIDSDEVHYTFTSRGGGLKLVELKDYPATVACGRNAGASPDIFASVNSRAPVPILSLTAPNLARADDAYELVKTDGSVKASRGFANGLVVEKEFRPGSNYMVDATVTLSNSSDQPIALPSTEWTIGTATPASQEDEAHLGMFWFSGKKTKHIEPPWFANRTLGCFPGTPRSVYMDGNSNAVWGAVHNQFFAIALAASSPADQIIARNLTLPPYRTNLELAPEPGSDWLLATNDFTNPDPFVTRLIRSQDTFSKYLVDRLTPETRNLLAKYSGGGGFAGFPVLLQDLNRLLTSLQFYGDNRTFFAQLQLPGSLRMLLEDEPRGADEIRLNRLLLEKAFAKELIQSPVGYQAALGYSPMTLAPGESVSRSFVLYAGPREYNTLAKIGSKLDNHLEGIMGYDGFFGFFAKALLLSMNTLHGLGLSYALAIICITIIIKTLFWPLTNASTKSMKRMAALQPQMKEIQTKFKEDPAKMNRKMMEFMKEHKVSPLGGCLPMLLQLPVFFGFFMMIRSAIELRGAEFLWVCDLSKPDTLFTIPGFNVPFNLLPLMMGATMLWQARMTPPAPGMDPTQQKIMRYMPLMFLVILYNFSAGLTLYWTVQNLLTIAQMKLTKARDPLPPGNTPVKPAPVIPTHPQRRKNKKNR